MQEILRRFIIFGGIKAYFESNGTRVISLQRFYGFKILSELQTDKARYSYKILVGPILCKKGQIWCFLLKIQSQKPYCY